MSAHVAGVWRYPVKSMLGEELDASAVSNRGLSGDRGYALVDTVTGKIASAKNPRKWATLFKCRATGESPASVTLPDGSVVSTDQADIDQRFSALLGREVKLWTVAPDNPSLEEYWPDIEGLEYRETVTDERFGKGAPPGTFFDYAPIHLLTTATLRRFAQLYPEGVFAVERFRPNLLLESEEDGFVENAWVGRTVRIGADLQLKVTNPCARCVMTTMAQGDLPTDHGILRAAAQHNRVMVPAAGQALPSVGVYATVVREGVVRKGDTLAIVS